MDLHIDKYFQSTEDATCKHMCQDQRLEAADDWIPWGEGTVGSCCYVHQ